MHLFERIQGCHVPHNLESQPLRSMIYVWTIPWRSSSTSLRCVHSTLLDVPNALFGGRLGGGIPRSPGQILGLHAVSPRSLPQQRRYFSGPKQSWAKNSTTSIIGHRWLSARYISSSASFSKGRQHARSSRAKLPEGRTPKARPAEELENSDPSEGVRFRTADLSEKEVASIFGPYIDQHEGNRILRLLHGQRLSGTLDQGLEVPHATAYVKSLVATGLIWLRANYPVDEDAAIRARVEKEQDEEERELLDDASRLGILPQQSTDRSRLYGVSGLDAIREHYESQPIAEVKPKVEGNRVKIGKLQSVNANRELCMHSSTHVYPTRHKSTGLGANLLSCSCDETKVLVRTSDHISWGRNPQTKYGKPQLHLRILDWNSRGPSGNVFGHPPWSPWL